MASLLDISSPPPYEVHQSVVNNTYATSTPADALNKSTQRLQRPIAVPATSPALGSPFLRAYAPDLAAYQISPELFLQFIDDLNRVAVKSPPLQVLGLAGSIVGFVPMATTQIVGNALNAAAVMGTVAVSKGRTELFLRDANRTIFAPRGLQLEIVKLEVVAKVAGIPILTAENKIDERAPLLAPMEDLDGSDSLSSHDRRLNVLANYIAPLEVSPLPDIQVKSNPLSRLSTAASERQRQKEEEKLVKSRREASEEYQKELVKLDKDFEKEKRKIEKDLAKARTKDVDKPQKQEKEIAKVVKEQDKLEREYEKKLHSLEKDRWKDDKEKSGMKKMLWLLIRNLDDELRAEGL